MEKCIITKGEIQRSLLFRVYEGGDLYSIPVQYVQRVESFAEKITAVLRSPEHIIGVYPTHGKSINIVDLGCLLGLKRTLGSKSSSHSLLIIENTGIGFLVETVLGVETLRSRQSPGPLSAPLVQSVYSCGGRDELVLELDVPRLLSIC